jgi:hypothetical protein
MAPKQCRRPSPESSQSSSSVSSEDTVSEAQVFDENAALRDGFQNYVKKCNEARDCKKDPPALLKFCDELKAKDSRIMRSSAGIRAIFMRAIKNNDGIVSRHIDPVVPKGRPSIGTDELQRHQFFEETQGDALHVNTSRLELTTFLSQVKAENSGSHIRKAPSKTEVLFLEADIKAEHGGDFIVSKGVTTGAARHAGCEPRVLDKHYDDLEDFFEAKPQLQKQPGRIINYDEMAAPSQAEKARQETAAYTTKDLLKLVGNRTALRTMALGDGTGNMTTIPFPKGDGLLLGVALVGAAPNAVSRPNYQAPASFTYKAIHGGDPYLPGIPSDVFESDFVRVYSTPSGSVDSGLIDNILCDWIFPKWRKEYPEGCVHHASVNCLANFFPTGHCCWCVTL